MNCAACENPPAGQYVAGCRRCALRSIARGPEYFASQKACKLTPAYMARLQTLGTVEEVHEEVKAVAKEIGA
jgi:hypothetical protein